MTETSVFFPPWLLYIILCKKWVGTAVRKAHCTSCQEFCNLGKPLESGEIAQEPPRDSCDCRARWKCACSRELPSGAPASPGKAGRLFHAAPQRRWPCGSTAMSAQRGWAGGKAAQPWATKPAHALGKGPQLGQQPGNNPTVLLSGT